MQRTSGTAKFSAIVALAATLASCGTQETKTSANRPKGPATEQPNADLMEGQGLYLALPASGLPAGADLVRVSLEPEYPDQINEVPPYDPMPMPMPMPRPLPGVLTRATETVWATATSTGIAISPMPVVNYEPYYFEFGIKDRLLMKDIRTGNYFVRVEILNSNTGVVHVEGSGTAKIVADKVSTAKIQMTKISRGGLVIVLEDQPASLPSTVGGVGCTKEGKKPVCIKSGSSYKFQSFSKNAQCVWTPDIETLAVVDSKLCKGLPGSEGLL